MSNSGMHCVSVLGFLLLASTAEAQLYPNTEASKGGFATTAYVSCLNEKDEIGGTKIVRSPILVSPDRRLRAYVEAESKAGSVTQKHYPSLPACTNYTRLFIAEGAKFQLLWMEIPLDGSLGNGIELADWSPDGRYLLFTTFHWTYFSDSFGFSLILFDTRARIFVRLYEQDMFRAFFKKEIGMHVRGRGFTPEGAVVFEASTDEFGMDEEATNAKIEKVWSLEIDTRVLRPLPEQYAVKRYGHVLPAKTK